MNEHDEKFITSFIIKEKRARYRFLLESDDPQRWREFLNKLNHFNEFIPQYTTWVPKYTELWRSEAAVTEALRAKGSPERVWIWHSSAGQGHWMNLEAAVEQLWQDNWGATISCIPGELAYYYDEEGRHRAFLERKPGT